MMAGDGGSLPDYYSHINSKTHFIYVTVGIPDTSENLSFTVV